MNKKIMTVEEACSLVKSGDTVVITGSGGGLMEPDYVLEGVEKRFQETGEPAGLTLVHVTGIGDRKERGVNRFAHKGMVKRVVGGHWGWSPRMMEMALNNEVEAYNLPQGILSLLTREIAAGRDGLLTPVGLKTFVDPRVEGGKLNEITEDDLVSIVNIGGKEQLFYKSFPINVTVLRGTTADEDGNISLEQEAANLDLLSSAQAAYNNDGIVIAQVKRIAQRGTLNPRMVKVPGFMVDAVVVYPEQWQTCEGEYNPSFSGEIKIPLDDIKPLEFNIRKVIARRAALELKPDTIVNLGFGMSDGVANIAAEEGIFDKIILTIEQGIVGGVPAKGDIFGAGYNPTAIIDAPSQFDFYHGGGLNTAFLGMAQLDKLGNVNVSKFGKVIAGCGGFIDITQNADEVIFCGTFTAGGLDIEIDDGRLKIVREGKYKKFITNVEQITFSGEYAREHGQRVLYVTERAVFQLKEEGIELIEIAPGIDIEKDILLHMDFKPLINKNLKIMDENLFKNDRIRLNERSSWK